MPQLPFRLDPAQCDQCGDCVRACAPGALELSGGFIAIDPARCDACEECALACPTTAITLTRRGKPLAVVPTTESPPLHRFHWLDPVVALTVLMALQFAMRWVPAGSEVSAGPGGRWVVLATTLVFYGAIVGTVWAIARVRHVGSAELGLAPFRVWATLAAIPALILVIWASRVGYAWVTRLFGLEAPSVREQVLGLFGEGPLGFLLAVVVTATLAPVVEELLFRGLVYRAFRERMPAKWAVMLSALIFAIHHFSLWLVVPILLLGIALAWLTEWQRSIWPAVGCHALNNLIAVLIIYFVPG